MAWLVYAPSGCPASNGVTTQPRACKRGSIRFFRVVHSLSGCGVIAGRSVCGSPLLPTLPADGKAGSVHSTVPQERPQPWTEDPENQPGSPVSRCRITFDA